VKRHVLAVALSAVTLFAASAQAATITPLNLDPANQGLNDPTPIAPVGGNPGVTIGEQRRIAYQYAADLWGGVLKSDVNIRVIASFQALECNLTTGRVVLGSAGPRSFVGGPNYPVPNVFYAIALANAVTGTQQSPTSTYEISSRFSSVYGTANCLPNAGWYYGLDGKTPAGKDNFLNVVMHEIGHGLGFLGLVGYAEGSASGILGDRVGVPGVSDVYTHSAYDNVKGLRFDNPGMTDADRSAALQMPGRTVWDGANVLANADLELAPKSAFIASGTLNANYEYYGVASFGPAATAANFTGQVVLANDGTGTDTADACEPLPAGSLTGKIAFVNRGGPPAPAPTCGFEKKAVNVQNAGATAVIIGNVQSTLNSSRSTGMADDPTLTAGIPALNLNLADGNAFRAALPGVNVTFGLVPGQLAGADASGRPRLYTPFVSAAGSTFSHYDTSHTPNALMEPANSADLDAALRLDLTPSLFKDIGWVTNAGNGMMGAAGDCDTRVPLIQEPGLIAGAYLQATDKLCRRAYAGNAAGYRTCIAPAVTRLNTLGFLNPTSRAAINRCVTK
jgi:hypothetical protein